MRPLLNQCSWTSSRATAFRLKGRRYYLASKRASSLNIPTRLSSARRPKFHPTLAALGAQPLSRSQFEPSAGGRGASDRRARPASRPIEQSGCRKPASGRGLWAAAQRLLELCNQLSQLDQAHCECAQAGRSLSASFMRPPKGWTNGERPTLLALRMEPLFLFAFEPAEQVKK